MEVFQIQLVVYRCCKQCAVILNEQRYGIKFVVEDMQQNFTVIMAKGWAGIVR